MIKRNDLVNFLKEYFEPYEEAALSREMLVNGLQVKGNEGIKKVGLGVSANLEFFEKANAAGCNFLIVHHGLGFSGVERTNLFPPHLEGRLKFLYQNNISLAGFHFMLDHHPEIGNNAWVIKKLGGEVVGNIHDKWGWFGRFPKPKPLEEIINDGRKIYEHEAHIVGAKKEKISTLAVVSGSGAIDYKNQTIINEYVESGVELQIVGDMKESHMAFAKELGLAIASFGHYNTETIGVKNLGEVIKKEFPGLSVEFIDVPNDL